GILILMINILGGIGVGMLQHDLDFSRAMEVYTLLTIGDGLVAQIPSLLLSTAAAIMVTRVNSESDVREQVVDQMFTSPKALTVAAGILVVMGLIPGMPHFSFITLGIVCAAGAFFIQRRVLVDEQVVEDQSRAQALMDAQQSQSPSGELGWDDVSPVDIVGLEVGYRLIPMVDKNQSGELLGRIKGIRKKLSQEIGFLVPAVHIRDNLELPPNGYRISLMGVTLGESEVHPDRHMAINPGQVFGNIEGLPVKDPAFGLDAVWIDNAIKDHAQTLGYTVVDASTVVATHMNTLLQKHVHELLGHEEVQQMIDRLARYSPKLVDTLVPETVSMSVLLKVLKGLLAEQLPVRDFRTIAEAIVANAAVNSEPMQLIESVRTALSRSIVQEIYGSDNNLSVFTLAPAMEQMLMKPSANGGLDVTLEPGLAEQLQRSISETAQAQELKGSPAVLLVPGPLRPILAKFVRFSSHALHVLSYNEIPDDKQVTI
ncbi:MAG TPA: flagellar biosynthesis protein FlhA, partial [Cellvibrionales bacterium]|nr:flagellar biosynthesis protein FlhA [Cellvibrionales bacterium]